MVIAGFLIRCAPDPSQAQDDVNIYSWSQLRLEHKDHQVLPSDLLEMAELNQSGQAGGVRSRAWRAFLAAGRSGLNSSTLSVVVRASSNCLASQNATTRFIPKALLPGARWNAPCQSSTASRR